MWSPPISRATSRISFGRGGLGAIGGDRRKIGRDQSIRPDCRRWRLRGWEAILRANLVATEHLLRAFEPQLEPQSVAVLIASMAGHIAPAAPEIDAVLDEPLAEDLLQRMQPLLQAVSRQGDPNGLAGSAYSCSKRAVIRMVERRAKAWGERGARIVSISPGMIWTPMGRREVETGPGAAAIVDATPVGRWGTPMDIANAVDFLVSDLAGFISGCDLRVDGGVTPTVRAMF